MMSSQELDQKISLVLPFACRVDILNKLAKAKDHEMQLTQILDTMIIKTSQADDHIKSLEKLKLIKHDAGKYIITKEGKSIHTALQEILSKAHF